MEYKDFELIEPLRDHEVKRWGVYGNNIVVTVNGDIRRSYLWSDENLSRAIEFANSIKKDGPVLEGFKLSMVTVYYPNINKRFIGIQ